MEPYSPEFRRALKDAHPGLRDTDIDRLEALTASRAQLQPDDRNIGYIDEQIDDLLRNKMPNFDKVAREYAAKQHAERAFRAAPRIEVKPKR